VRQFAVLLEHLRGIATRPAVDPVALAASAAAALAATIVPAAAPAIVVAIILVQRKSVSLPNDRTPGRMTPSTARLRCVVPICMPGGLCRRFVSK
jgi:hypothetical protein